MMYTFQTPISRSLVALQFCDVEGIEVTRSDSHFFSQECRQAPAVAMI
jgi:hypothetical protein